MAERLTRVRRTKAQAVLYLVSLVMLALGSIDCLFGIAMIVVDPTARGSQSEVELAIVGVAVVAAGALVLVTGAMGYVASKDYSFAPTYRFFCYAVSLCILLVIIYGWSNGDILIFDPLILAATIVYVLICSTLADHIERDWELGVQGTLVVRDNLQSALHFISAVIALVGILFLMAAVSSAILLATGLEPFRQAFFDIDLFPLPLAREALPALASLGAAMTGLAGIALGFAGIWCSNHPRYIVGYFVMAALTCAAQTYSFTSATLAAGVFSGSAPGSAIGALFSGAGALLAARIMLHREREGAGEECDGASVSEAEEAVRP